MVNRRMSSEDRDENLKYLKRLGERIEKFRMKEGLSQQQLSDAVGVSASTIYRYENPDSGSRAIPLVYLHRIARAIKAPIEFLVETGESADYNQTLVHRHDENSLDEIKVQLFDADLNVMTTTSHQRTFASILDLKNTKEIFVSSYDLYDLLTKPTIHFNSWLEDSDHNFRVIYPAYDFLKNSYDTRGILRDGKQRARAHVSELWTLHDWVENDKYSQQIEVRFATELFVANIIVCKRHDGNNRLLYIPFISGGSSTGRFSMTYRPGTLFEVDHATFVRTSYNSGEEQFNWFNYFYFRYAETLEEMAERIEVDIDDSEKFLRTLHKWSWSNNPDEKRKYEKLLDLDRDTTKQFLHLSQWIRASNPVNYPSGELNATPEDIKKLIDTIKSQIIDVPDNFHFSTQNLIYGNEHSPVQFFNAKWETPAGLKLRTFLRNAKSILLASSMLPRSVWDQSILDVLSEIIDRGGSVQLVLPSERLLTEPLNTNGIVERENYKRLLSTVITQLEQIKDWLDRDNADVEIRLSDARPVCNVLHRQGEANEDRELIYVPFVYGDAGGSDSDRPHDRPGLIASSGDLEGLYANLHRRYVQKYWDAARTMKSIELGEMIERLEQFHNRVKSSQEDIYQLWASRYF